MRLSLPSRLPPPRLPPSASLSTARAAAVARTLLLPALHRAAGGWGSSPAAGVRRAHLRLSLIHPGGADLLPTSACAVGIVVSQVEEKRRAPRQGCLRQPVRHPSRGSGGTGALPTPVRRAARL